jgi:phosphohistidine swiveling domain-containing protein
VDVLSHSELEAIRSQVLTIEALFGSPVDVEFAISVSGALVILQARPIAARRFAPRGEVVRDGVRVVPVDDLPAAASVATGRLMDLVQNRTDKRHYVRTAASAAGISTSSEWLIADGAGLDSSTSALRLADVALDITSTDVVELGTPDEPPVRVRRDSLTKEIATRRRRQGEAIFVAEVHVGATSGYSAIQPDGSMVVEYVPGAAGGLMFGDGPFSVVVVDRDGRRLVEHRRRAASWWVMEPDSLAIVERRSPREPEALDDGALAEIRHITEEMQAQFGEVRLEWIRLQNGEVRLWDLSVESGAPLPAKQTGVIAHGSVRGTAVVLEDVSEWSQISHDRSVVPDAEFLAAHNSADAMEARERLLAGIENPIIVTALPRTTLALLIGHVGGFVFDDAAMLCHLAIILREEGVPAVVREHATRDIRNGAPIEIVGGMCRVLS